MSRRAVRVATLVLSLVVVVLGGCASPRPADAPPRGIDSRPVHTYSIVGRDPTTKTMGVAVQSHWFSVGSLVPWAEAGTGVVATQSFVDPAYGPRGLDLMRSGMSARAALESLLATDDGRDLRQVAFLDAKGGIAAHSGRRCIEWAGHRIGEHHSAQANLMRNEGVVPAMSRAFEDTAGDLAERLLAALEAAEAVGGDLRGKQSAALLVVKGDATGRVWEDRVVELRVEDHPEPVKELRRLLVVERAYRHMNAGDQALEKGDLDAALREYAAATEMLPDSVELRFWNGVTLATNGHLDRALPIFESVFARDASWAELLRRLPAAGLIEEDLVAKIRERTRR